MIAPTDVERFRTRPPTPQSPVLSVYLDVDRSRPGNFRREFETAWKARLRTLEIGLAPAERQALRADAGRVQDRVDEYESNAKTLVVFADDSADLTWSGQLHVPLPTDIRWRPTPYVRPLVEALDEHERYGVVLTNKQRARLFVVFLGEIEEQREVIAPAEVRHKKASGTDHLRSDMHFQRQDEVHVHWHLRRVVELTKELVRAKGLDRVLLAGPVEATSELASMVPPALADRLAGTLHLAVEAPIAEVLSQTLDAAERAERAAEVAVVTQLLEQPGARGLQQTLLALQEGRLLVLAYADGFGAHGAECPRCHALLADAGPACAYCGAPPAALDDLLERLIERSAEVGGKVEMMRGEAAERLRGVGGIGALLRF